MKPTYEELEARCNQLEEVLKKALDRIAELKERLNQNSKNSSKPPSSDPKPNRPPKDGKGRKPRDGMARSLLPLD